MVSVPGLSRHGTEAACAGVRYDPGQPIPPRRLSPEAAGCRINQRLRKSQILATIRRILAEEGFEAVTVRRIAAESNHAVQTIYNLVGPRDEAIVEAIGEYTRFVGRTVQPAPEDPGAVMDLAHGWLLSIAASPEFCRNVSLIFFTPARAIFYEFRDRQLKSMRSLLVRQQKLGVLRSSVDVNDLAEQLVLFASAECLEWADRSASLERLQRRLCSGYANLLAGALSPNVRPAPRPAVRLADLAD